MNTDSTKAFIIIAASLAAGLGVAAASAAASGNGASAAADPSCGHLQRPAEALRGLPRTGDGNGVDWVKALEQRLISPRNDLEDPDAEPLMMDLVIVREVKGSMPDVVFPHRQHAEWLSCRDCHNEIFIPAKGENRISMAAILLGQTCGVCHGTVAFPVTDCRRCHAKPKAAEWLKSRWSARWVGR